MPSSKWQRCECCKENDFNEKHFYHIIVSDEGQEVIESLWGDFIKEDEVWKEHVTSDIQEIDGYQTVYLGLPTRLSAVLPQSQEL